MEQTDLLVYPTIGNGMFNVSARGSLVPGKFELSVYSMKGIKVLAKEFLAGSSSSFDLRSFPTSEYLVVLSDKTRIIQSIKVIKIQ